MAQQFMDKPSPRISPVTENAFHGNSQHPEEEVIDLSEYIRLIRRNIWGIAAITLFCALIGALYATSSTPLYRATSTVMADPIQPNATNSEQYLATALVLLFYETQYEIIRSRNVAEKVVDKLGLVERHKAKQAKLASENSSGVGESIDSLKTEIKALFGPIEEPKAPLSDEDLKITLAEQIQAGLEVSGGKQSQFINISYVNADPALAKDIVNAIAETYIQFGLDSRLEEVKNTESWLSKQFQQLSQQLKESETRLSQYTEQHGLVDTSQQERVVNAQLQTLNSELIKAQTELGSIEDQYLAIQRANSKELYSLSPVLANNTVRDMIKAQAQQSQKVSELSERYGKRHPKLISASSELQNATNNLEVEVAKVVENIKKSYKLAKLRVNNINRLIRKQQKSVQNLQDENFGLVSLERDVENNRKIYENFQASLMEASLRSEYDASNVQIVDPATTPAAPFKPNIKLIVAIAGLLGLFLGIAFVFLREALDNTFKTTSDIEEKLKSPSLGISPKVQKSKSTAPPEMQYLDNSRTPFSENINTIRTGLMFSNIDSPPKSILVTSATGSEGKTTLAINLAAAFSQQGKTLLLEMDLRKPSISKYLKLSEKKGITDLISSPTPNQESFMSTIDNLSILTCGTQPPNPLEIISSTKFSHYLKELESHFDHIIVDGPPVMPVSDSCILANQVDGVIFTVKANETHIKICKEAIERLTSHNGNMIGAVLSMAEPRKMKYYGNHYYSDEYYGHTEAVTT